MRREFSSAIQRIATDNDRVVFLTGDLGFDALENIEKAIGERFINVGVSEQNMISMASGLASEGYIVVCYSITPFAVFRPAEQIRLDVCLHNMDVKIVGNGGGYGYGIMGATHHGIEDIAVMSCFQNMKCYVPFSNEDVEELVGHMMARRGPCYLRLGYGAKPGDLAYPSYSHTRKLLKGGRISVVCMGPVGLNVFRAMELCRISREGLDLFVVSEMPMEEITGELEESLRRTGKLVVVEEHVRRGGMAENLALLLMEKGICCRVQHLCAKGYPEARYGGQGYHQKQCGLDADSIASVLRRFLDER
jgi:transketolase